MPQVGTPEWWSAADETKIAALLWDTLRLADLLEEPYDWRSGDGFAEAIANHVSELKRRRTQPGPLLRHFDAAAARRWVETGDSNSSVAA